MMCSIDYLPDETHMKIFSYLEVSDLLVCGLVNSRWRQLSSDDTFWKLFLPHACKLPKENIKQHVFQHFVISDKRLFRLIKSTDEKSYSGTLELYTHCTELLPSNSYKIDSKLVKVKRIEPDLEKMGPDHLTVIRISIVFQEQFNVVRAIKNEFEASGTGAKAALGLIAVTQLIAFGVHLFNGNQVDAN